MDERNFRRDTDSLLKHILRADAEARKMTENASAERENAAKQLPQQKETLRIQFEAETEQMLQRTRDSVRKSTGKKLEEIARERDEKLRRLDELAESRTAAWVEQVYIAVLRG